MSKIWITRVQPHHFFIEGVMRYTLWFKKPTYTESVFVCPVFGPLKQNEFQYGCWEGDNSGIPLKMFKHQSPELLRRVYQDSLMCYIPECRDQDNAYIFLSNKLKEAESELLGNIPSTMSDDDRENAEHAAHIEQLYIQAEKTIEVKGKGWREHILEYELDISIL
jgi:hypothetical protein